MARAVPDLVKGGRWLRLAHLRHRRAWRRNHGDRRLAVLDGVHAHDDGFAGGRVHDGGRFADPERDVHRSLLAFVERGIVPAG